MFRAPQLPRTLEAALRDVRSAKPAVRAEALRELVPHADVDRPRVVGALEALLGDEAPQVRAAAATAIADVNGNQALPALLKAVEDRDVHVGQMAIAALGELADARAVEPLRRALHDDRPEIRFQAVMAFPRVCAPRSEALAALVKATHDDDALVVHIALRMIEELSGDGELEPLVITRSRALLRHDSPVVRVAAAILAVRGDEPPPDRAVEILVGVARGEIATSDGEDIAAAIELCGDLALDGAKAGLERRAFGSAIALRRDRFAWHARVALARMGHERASQEIMAELGAWTRDKRTLAVAAAGRARLVAARDLILAMRRDAARADPAAVEEALLALDRAEAP